MSTNLFDGPTLVGLFANTERTATANGTGVDVRDYVGKGIAILDAEAGGGTTPTLDVKLQDSADNSTFTDISGAAFAQLTDAADALEGIAIDFDELDRYVRAVVTITGSTPTFVCAVHFLGRKQRV